ncbi:fluoride efflux transporter CrcB [Caldibacillus thermolactis]|jgi:fluoride exporter|uniref:Fluoride-specific ion channel FluC n=1 Tax=Pallidibacillus thermolactis TaxID=251051 RepID=A0ABT2WH33_9BACI|nr:fluoride efflux transporter CrcB [Pallidibacillus thermolactis]MCU9595005.1 fluoride efflux transporter CrcB [Pallidibacillus thermolactis]MED1673506.1 fluoride efflux transporter CrcB [Pallidibacillus thermolactis subsp. kokeshiiformis]
MKLLFVMIGGFFGAICRFALSEWIHTNNEFPLATLLINESGCFLLGWFLTFVSQLRKIRPEFTLLVGTGFIGSFTTFSTFSMETLSLIQSGFIFMAFFYVLTSTVLGILLAYAGYHFAIAKREK